MIAGHLGLVGAVARLRPRASLWWLAPASVAPDLLDIAYAAAGVCNPSGLYSHTLPAAIMLAAVIAGAAVLAGRRETGLVAFLLVLLHLPLDFITGRKLFWPGAELQGLNFYDRPVVNFALEIGMLALGLALVRVVPNRPWWVRSRVLLALLVAAQAVSAAREDGIKPTACQATRGVSRP